MEKIREILKKGLSNCICTDCNCSICVEQQSNVESDILGWHKQEINSLLDELEKEATKLSFRKETTTEASATSFASQKVEWFLSLADLRHKIQKLKSER